VKVQLLDERARRKGMKAVSGLPGITILSDCSSTIAPLPFGSLWCYASCNHVNWVQKLKENLSQ
jgi:hypothetical protein